PSCEFACELGGVSLDVHVALLNATWLNSGSLWENEELWKRTEPFEILGVPALRLGPTDQLLHLASHTVFHHLDWSAAGVEDVRRLLTRVDVDWPFTIRLAHQQRMSIPLWLVLSSSTVQ